MRKVVIFCILCLPAFIFSCGSQSQTTGEKFVVIKTDQGDMKVKLYNETPQHRDNFFKLVGEGFYNDLLFHRVIKNFMIQGGDPSSRNAGQGVRLGNGGPEYTIPAEFKPELFHKKGALAAARTGDQVNPEKRSSGSQFYIVQGKVFRSGELDTLEMNINMGLQQRIIQKYFAPAQEELEKYRQEGKQDLFNKRMSDLKAKADSEFQISPKVKFSPKQKEVYTTIGGTPHLDGGYTVFGEVVEGLEVIDKIAGVPTDPNNRPLKDEKMKIITAK